MNSACFVIVAFLLALSSFTFIPSITSTAQSSSQSCPASDTIHITWYGGLPTSFNNLGPFNLGGVFSQIEAVLAGGTPPVFPDGSPASFMTVADTITHNSNYTVWTVHIKPGTKWYDGTNVSAADYLGVFSASFALNPNYDPIGLHSEITGVTELNTSSVQFTLNVTDAHFSERIDNYLTSNLYPTKLTSQNVTTNGFNLAFGDGPFYIDNYTAGQSELIMMRNPYYNPQPKACEVVWNFVESESQTANYIAAGSSDFAPVSPQSISSLITNPNIHVINQPEWMTYMQYNVSVYPYNMTQFRQALVYGINESQLAQYGFAGYATPAYAGEGTVRPGTLWYNSNQPSYSFNQTKSLGLLKSVGFTQDSSGTLHYPNGTAVTLSLFSDSATSADPVMAQFVTQDLKALGITVNVQVVSLSSMIGDLFGDQQGIQHSMIVYTSQGLVNTPYYMSQPAAFTWEVPGPTPANYVSPPSANTEYQGNLSALTATGNTTAEGAYFNNIQSIFAQYLPTAPLLFVDNTVAYSTAHFTGWPSPNGFMFGDGFWNLTALANLTPVGSTTTTNSSTPSISSSGSSSQSQSTTSQSTTNSSSLATSAFSSSSTSSGGLSNTTLIAIGVIVIIVVIALGVLFTRRRGAPATTTT
ncbi:MAG: ABC transporter substrate-binding protein [Nitrososphaerales archaeon]